MINSGRNIVLMLVGVVMLAALVGASQGGAAPAKPNPKPAKGSLARIVPALFFFFFCTLTITNGASSQSDRAGWLKQPIYAQVDKVAERPLSRSLNTEREKAQKRVDDVNDEKGAADARAALSRVDAKIAKARRFVILCRVAELWRVRPGNVGPTTEVFQLSPCIIATPVPDKGVSELKAGDYIVLRNVEEIVTKGRDKFFQNLIADTALNEQLAKLAEHSEWDIKHLFAEARWKSTTKPDKWPDHSVTTPWNVGDPNLTADAKLTTEILERRDRLTGSYSTLKLRVKNGGTLNVRKALVTFIVRAKDGSALEEAKRVVVPGGSTDANIGPIPAGQSIEVKISIRSTTAADAHGVDVVCRELTRD